MDDLKKTNSTPLEEKSWCARFQTSAQHETKRTRVESRLVCDSYNDGDEAIVLQIFNNPTETLTASPGAENPFAIESVSFMYQLHRAVLCTLLLQWTPIRVYLLWRTSDAVGASESFRHLYVMCGCVLYTCWLCCWLCSSCRAKRVCKDAKFDLSSAFSWHTLSKRCSSTCSFCVRRNTW